MPSGVYDRTKTKFNKGLFKKRDPRITGKNNRSWKNGKYKDKDGYFLVLKPKHPFCDGRGYIRKHRLIVEKHLGRYLKSTEDCHHINEIKNDNRPKNLMAFINNSAHTRFHYNPNNVKPEEIIFDGRKL